MALPMSHWALCPPPTMTSHVASCPLCQVRSLPDHSSLAPGPPLPAIVSRSWHRGLELPSICVALPWLFPRPSVICTLSPCTESRFTGTCMPLHLSSSFIVSLGGFQVGWSLVTQDPSSLGHLLLSRVTKVLLSCPGLFSDRSCLPQLSILLDICGH